MRSIPMEMNTSDSWAVGTPSTTCLQWLPLPLLFSPFHEWQTRANCGTCKRVAHMPAHTHPHRDAIPHTDSWGVTLLAWHSERNTEEDRQDRSCQRGRRDTESASHCKGWSTCEVSTPLQLDGMIITSAQVNHPIQGVNCRSGWRGYWVKGPDLKITSHN